MRYLYAFLICSVIVSCNTDQQGKPQPHFSTSVDTLTSLIQFPVSVSAAKWDITKLGNIYNDRVPGPDDYSLCAEVICNDKDWTTLRNYFNRNKAADLITNIDLKTSFVRSWFSSATKRIFIKQGSYLKIKGLVYAFNLQNGKSSFTNGFICFIGKNIILLTVSTD